VEAEALLQGKNTGKIAVAEQTRTGLPEVQRRRSVGQGDMAGSHVLDTAVVFACKSLPRGVKVHIEVVDVQTDYNVSGRKRVGCGIGRAENPSLLGQRHSEPIG